jgi:hypothetical protein
VRPNDVFIAEGAGNFGLAINRYRPWLRFETPRVGGRVGFVGAEFIKIIVASDVFKRGGGRAAAEITAQVVNLLANEAKVF